MPGIVLLTFALGSPWRAQAREALVERRLPTFARSSFMIDRLRHDKNQMDDREDG